MNHTHELEIPIGTQALIFSKHYYSVLSKHLESIDIERYYAVLYFIYKNRNCKQQEISNSLGIDKSAMVKVIDYLIKTGFVDRNINPNDRREHFIVFTKKGLRQTEVIVNSFDEIDKEMFSEIKENDKEIFLEVLAHLTTHLSSLPATDLFFNYKKTARKKKKVNDAV